MYIAQSQRQHSVCVGDCSRTAVKQTRMNMLQLKCDNMAPTYLHVFAERDDRWLRNCPKYGTKILAKYPESGDHYPAIGTNTQKVFQITRNRWKYPELGQNTQNWPKYMEIILPNTQKLAKIPENCPKYPDMGQIQIPWNWPNWPKYSEIDQNTYKLSQIPGNLSYLLFRNWPTYSKIGQYTG